MKATEMPMPSDTKSWITSKDVPTSAQFKAWREGLGWSRREAASKLQYTNTSAISQMETGLRKVPKRVAIMMQLYDMNLDGLSLAVGEYPTPDAVETAEQ